MCIRDSNVVILDTAGRLHVDEGMMEELENIKEAVNVDQTILVVDAMTGQDAVNVASNFQDKVGIDGVILTKLDGTAKGGIAVAIQSELKVPVKYIGVGETIEDLQKFNSEEFVNALFDVNMEDIGELHLPEDEQQTDTQEE